jgi:hypothetical protein
MYHGGPTGVQNPLVARKREPMATVKARKKEEIE